jgi:hypothetical protein
MNDVFILLSYSIIFFLLLPIFFLYPVEFSFLLEKKVFLSPSLYKTGLVYLYGIPGAWSVLISYGISILFLLYFYIKRIPCPRKIIYLPLITPFFISYFSYVLTTSFSLQGTCGSLIHILVTQKTTLPQSLLSAVIFFLLYFFFTGTTGIHYLMMSIKKTIRILRLKEILVVLTLNFLSWIKYFFKIKSIKIDKSYEIEELLHKKILSDFEKAFSISRGKKKKEELDQPKKEMIFGETKIFQNKEKKFEYEIEEDDSDLLLCKENLEYFSLSYDSIIHIHGPVVNTTLIKPQKQISMQKIQEILPNFTRLMGKPDLRFIYPVKNHPQAIAFEYSHSKEKTLFFDEWVNFGDLLNTEDLKIPLGLDTYGEIFYLSLTNAPHLLIAGTTGSGKSSVIQTIICSLLSKYAPINLRLGLIDPKKSEFFYFDYLPHLISPVAYTIESAESIIDKALEIMNERYSLFNKKMIKNIQEYHTKYGALEYLVIIIDEYADLIMQSKTIEKKIIRLLQMSRAAGIHVILATQRPSFDIINSSVKSNLPVRIACRVTNSINSRIILDTEGAEKLLGKGDMLISFPGEIKRVHAFYCTQEFIYEINKFYQN